MPAKPRTDREKPGTKHINPVQFGISPLDTGPLNNETILLSKQKFLELIQAQKDALNALEGLIAGKSTHRHRKSSSRRPDIMSNETPELITPEPSTPMPVFERDISREKVEIVWGALDFSEANAQTVVETATKAGLPPQLVQDALYVLLHENRAERVKKIDPNTKRKTNAFVYWRIDLPYIEDTTRQAIDLDWLQEQIPCGTKRAVTIKSLCKRLEKENDRYFAESTIRDACNRLVMDAKRGVRKRGKLSKKTRKFDARPFKYYREESSPLLTEETTEIASQKSI
jgi:hypothetical protein